MFSWETQIKRLLELGGLTDIKLEIDLEHNHASLHIFDIPLPKETLPTLIEHWNHVMQLLAKKNDVPALYFDINNYRKERERLITELARTAAKKVSTTKEPLALPAMNSYERRLVHTELAMNPSVATESDGVGKQRFVMIKPL